MRLRATKLAAIGFGGARPPSPSLDLQFATDKTLTARRGPTPVFTRTSGATQVNAAGLIEYAPENLILYSNNVENASWSVGGGTIASSAETVNGLTAEIYNEDSANSIHRFFRVNTGLAGITSTFSVWLKAAGRRYVCVNFGSSGPNANSKLVLDLVDRVVIAGTAGVTTNILLENNGWARYSFTFVPRVDSGTMPIQSNFSSTVVSETGVGLNGAAFYVAGQQYERSSTARPYLLTTANPAHTPRFDHDPVTLACKGLLIEESRTNFVLNSDLYLTSTPTNITATTITGTSVTGSNQIRELSLTSSGASTGVQANLTGTGTGIKTLSVFIKKPSANAAPYFTIGFASSTVQYAGIQVTMTGSTPVVSVTSTATGGFSVVSSSVETFPSGWYRISVIVNGVPASCFPTFYPSNAVWNGTSDIRQTLTAAGTNLVYVFGAQVELGYFPTSYIPTAAAAVPRSADVCSITGSDFTGFYNQSEGTFSMRAISLMSNDVGGNRSFISFSSGTYVSQISIIKASAIPDIKLAISTAAPPASGSITQNAEFNISAGLKASDTKTSLNGGSVVPVTASTLPVVNSFRLQDATQAGAGQASFTIASFRYYKKHLSDAKLQKLATL